MGGTLGAKINQKLPSKTIVIILRIVLILVGIRLIYRGLFQTYSEKSQLVERI